MRRRRIILLGLIGLLLLTGLATWKRRGLAHHISQWRATALVDKSVALGSEGEWDAASQAALAAWQLLPGEITALRQLYRSGLESRAPFLLKAARDLFFHYESTYAERIDVVRLFYSVGDHVTVSYLLGKFPGNEQGTAAVLDLKARFLLVRKRPQEGLRLVEELRQLRNDPEDLLLKAEALAALSSAGDAARQQAQAIIAQLMAPSHPPQVALRAFALLQQIPQESRDLGLFENADSQLQQHLGNSPIPPTLRLLLAELELARHPDQRDAILTGIIEKENTENRLALAEWLVAMDAPQRGRELATETERSSNPEWFILTVRSYLQESDWEKAQQALEQPAPGVDLAIVFCLRAIASAARDQKTQAIQWWERAYRQAELSVGRASLLQVARLSASVGNTAIRNRAVTEALKRPSAIPLPTADVSFLFSHLVEQNSSDDLLRISEGLLANEPNNPLLINNVLWLSLLQGRKDDASIAKLEALLDQHPFITGLRTTLALAYLEDERTAEAAEVLMQIPEAARVREKLGPTDRAVWAILYTKQDRHEDARAMMETLEWDDMMVVERDFFQQRLEPSDKIK